MFTFAKRHENGLNTLFISLAQYSVSTLEQQDAFFTIKLCHFFLSLIQGTLEFEYPDPQFHVQKGSNETYQDFDIFAHGGMIFWLTSSLVFFLVSLINELGILE